MTTIEQLVGLTAQHNEIIKRVGNGSLNPISVRRAFQDIIEGARKTLSTVERVARQIDAWTNLGVEITEERYEQILKAAEAFRPINDTDKPLVTGGFGYDNPTALVKKFFEVLRPADGYEKSNYIEDTQLRYVSGMRPTGELRLVHYDSDAFSGRSPKFARRKARSDGLRLAGIEVFERVILEPETGLSWGKVWNSFPNASGLNMKDIIGQSNVPHLYRRNNDRHFEFATHSVDVGYHGWSSPVIREC